MKYLLLFLLILIFLSCSNFNKNKDAKNSQSEVLFYSDYIIEGRKLAKAKNYKGAATKFTYAFRENPNHVQSSHIVDAAYYWMLADEVDSAFLQLNTFISDTDYVMKKITDLTKDRRLSPLQKYPMWKTVIDGMKRNRNRKFPNINSELADQLDEILYQDQYYRKMIDNMESKYGKNSTEIKNFNKHGYTQDSINLKKVLSIIDKYGWLGAEEVGYDGNTALFLVIQHADSATQRKYLPLLRDAAKKGKASSEDLSFLEDRVAIDQGKRQIYGSQIGYDPILKQMIVLPLEDPINVDKRRASVGLQTMSDYLMHWNLLWDAKSYEQNLPYYEQNMKSIQKKYDSLNILKMKLE